MTSWGLSLSGKNMTGFEELVPVKDTDEKKISIVRLAPSGRLACYKELSLYDTAVFRYLSSCFSPFLPRVYEFEEAGGRLRVLEEYIPGECLAFALENKKIKRADGLRILSDVCSAAQFLHSAKPFPVIHRDIKPQNVMLKADGGAVLIDYDSAVMYTPGEERDSVLAGTAGFAAPEQYGFRQSDERTDVYAIGQLMTLLFPRDQRLKKIAARASELDPANRYGSVSELMYAVKRRIRGPKPEPKDAEYFCTNCGAVLNGQPGFKYNDGTWVCAQCGTQLYGEGIGDTGDNLSGVIWYCDGCGVIMNGQPGFDYYADEWVCTECGFLNDITADNIDDGVKRK